MEKFDDEADFQLLKYRQGKACEMSIVQKSLIFKDPDFYYAPVDGPIEKEVFFCTVNYLGTIYELCFTYFDVGIRGCIRNSKESIVSGFDLASLPSWIWRLDLAINSYQVIDRMYL